MFNFKKPAKPVCTPTSTPANTRLYAVGDVHGRADLLKKMLDLIEADIATTSAEVTARVIFLGDYIDRGQASDEVLAQLLTWRARFTETVFLKGNHEEVMLDFLADPEEMQSWIDWGGDATLESYGSQAVFARDPFSLRDELAANLPEEHFNFLMNLPTYHQSGDYIFVHAGLLPGITLEAQRQRDLLWIRDVFYNTEAEDWGGKCIVHGHTPQGTPENLSWRINVDTGAFKTGHLTAIVLEGTGRRFLST